MKDLLTYINESQNKNLQNAFNVLKKIFHVNPEYSKDNTYVSVEIDTKRTTQTITIYDEDKDHVTIKTSLYEDAYVVPNTIEDIEKFLKEYQKGNISDNAIEVQKYRKSITK